MRKKFESVIEGEYSAVREPVPEAVSSATSGSVEEESIDLEEWVARKCGGLVDEIAVEPRGVIDGEPTEEHDRAVQAALYTRAIGCVRKRDVVGGDGQVRTLEEEMPPDVGAAKLWLQSRRPGQWGEKRQERLRVVIDRLGDGRERVAVGYEVSGGDEG